ncbi:Neuronal cell adhesion molecule [Trichinella pseudospiralis]
MEYRCNFVILFSTFLLATITTQLSTNKHNNDSSVRVSPSQPSLAELGVGENQINISWIPGSYDAANPTPVGDKFFFKYRMKGMDQWEEAFPDGNNFSVTLDDLYPGTVYEVKSVSVVETEQGGLETESPVYYMSTLGRGNGSLAAWLIAVLVAILFLIFILLAIFFVVRCRGAKYPVSAKEKEQGREPMLKDDKGFGEYTYPDSMTDDRPWLNTVMVKLVVSLKMVPLLVNMVIPNTSVVVVQQTEQTQTYRHLCKQYKRLII